MRDHPDLCIQRQKLEIRKKKVRFDREENIRRLQKKIFPHPHNFLRHKPLPVIISNMFNDRVWKHYIKFIVAELFHITRIPENILHVWICDFNPLKIEDHNFNSGFLRPSHPLPKSLRSSYIEYFYRTRERCKKRFEQIKPPPPQYWIDRVWFVRVKKVFERQITPHRIRRKLSPVDVGNILICIWMSINKLCSIFWKCSL